jgi:DNA (cytosine-5)-methyltransferase 1
VKAYYNENDPKAAMWLRNLMFEGLIAWGDVDERSIEDVKPSELAGYTQCHFFAGIGGWSYALRLAGWPDDREVWTGSCPCQPFSAAGKGDGFADERHLWPAWFHLISAVKPDCIFGEQVASKAGTAWLDLVLRDVAMEKYASGVANLPAACVGAPHVRQRLYWTAHLANASRSRREGVYETSGRINLQPAASVEQRSRMWLSEPVVGRMADGVPHRMELLRGYGNAIVPQVAAAFIEAYCES